MTCFCPLPYLQGAISLKTFKCKPRVLSRTPENLERTSLRLPCGQCIGCRLAYSAEWAARLMHESQMHEHSSFVTLTYNDQFLPENGALNYDHITKFMKRLRKALGDTKIRFYMAPEYGDKSKRPHYHIIIFGYDFPDKVLLKNSNGTPLYISDFIKSLWSDPVTKESYGHNSVGSVTFESCAYVARYMLKKVKGEDYKMRYWTDIDSNGEILPLPIEKARMSNKPGIGKDWFDKFYESDVKHHDFVVINRGGKMVQMPPPAYYMRLLETLDPESYYNIKAARILDADNFADNNTEERLLVRKTVRERKVKELIRPVSQGLT